MSRSLLTSLAGVIAAFPAGAQTPASYRFQPRDTIRYQELTTGSVTMQVPQRQVTVRTSHLGTVAMVATGSGNAVRAWYEALELSQDGVTPQPNRPGTSTLLRQPFHLRITPTGHITIDSVPAISPEIAQMTDLTRQFDDFLISLPETALTRGAQWADTLVHTRPGRPTDTYRGHRIRSYWVRGDTSIAGKQGVVVEVTQRVEIHGTAPLPGQDATASTQLTGTENGVAVFSPALGRLIARAREGSLTGQLTVVGAAMPPIAQAWQYTSTISMLH